MRISELNWMQVERYLAGDDRAVIPIGSTEQHAYLSLATDSIEAERLAVESAEPLGVVVFPTVNYGIAPYWLGFPGSVSLRVRTLAAVVEDLLESLHATGFRRIVIANGHGGNDPVKGFIQDWVATRPGVAVKYHNWWQTARARAKIQALCGEVGHASWLENFPWTRLADVESPPASRPVIDMERFLRMDRAAVRAMVGDGNCGGPYRLPDEDMAGLWALAVEELRQAIVGPWER